VIIGVVLDYLKGHATDGILLDGFPRTIAQAEGLEKAMSGENVQVVSIDVPDEEVVDRLSSRRVCVSCGRVYNPALGLQPPGGKCLCGGEITQRDDDKADTILKRLMVYHFQTEPVIEFYQKRGSAHRIPGVGTPAQVFERIREAIG